MCLHKSNNSHDYLLTCLKYIVTVIQNSMDISFLKVTQLIYIYVY